MDVDIDFRTDFDPLDYFETAVRASMVKNQELAKHPAGAYLQNMPADKLSGLAAIPYDVAEEMGYTKIDFLHLNILDHFESKEEIRALLKVEPDWFLLESAEVVGKLFQLHRHFDIVYAVKPRSVQEVADCIALIRPGKRNLLNAYLKNKEKTRPMLYRQEGDAKSAFRRSHSIAYALTIILQLHLIRGKVL
jgi:DNA polymerase III alpha subunit